MPDPSPADLLARLERLEAEAAIHAVLYAYGSALDHGDRGQFLDCFTDDAEYVVTMRIASDRGMTFRGHEELSAYFDGHTHAPDAWHKHVTTNPAVAVDRDRATVTSYFLRVDAADDPGPATVLASGRYQDAFVREGGRWRIRSRRCEVENL